MPECKQVCDSKAKWEINAQGEKVFASNENCRDKTLEKCDLVDKVTEEQVPADTCRDLPDRPKEGGPDHQHQEHLLCHWGQRVQSE